MYHYDVLVFTSDVVSILLQESVPSEERVQVMRENTYVRVCGTVRSFNGKKSIVAFKVIPVTDMNEMTYHMLEVIHSHASVGSQSSVSKFWNGISFVYRFSSMWPGLQFIQG